MSGYDEYLTMVFGNYMTEPPKEEQVPHHDIAYLDLNSPCCEYDSKRR
jgi:lipopolysaccharide cholinephosphotransferase